MEKSIMALHTEHTEWVSKLSFYRDDLQVMQNRLDEIAQKNNGKEVMSEVERFQNQLIIQREQIDILKHEIREHEASIEKTVLNNPIASDHRKMNDHPEQREKIARFEELFAKFRNELMQFLSKTM